MAVELENPAMTPKHPVELADEGMRLCTTQTTPGAMPAYHGAGSVATGRCHQPADGPSCRPAHWQPPQQATCEAAAQPSAGEGPKPADHQGAGDLQQQAKVQPPSGNETLPAAITSTKGAATSRQQGCHHRPRKHQINNTGGSALMASNRAIGCEHSSMNPTSLELKLMAQVVGSLILRG